MCFKHKENALARKIILVSIMIKQKWQTFQSRKCLLDETATFLICLFKLKFIAFLLDSVILTWYSVDGEVSPSRITRTLILN